MTDMNEMERAPVSFRFRLARGTGFTGMIIMAVPFGRAQAPVEYSRQVF